MKEFHSFATMGAAIGYLEEACPSKTVAEIVFAIAVDHKIAGLTDEYMIPRELPIKAMLANIPTSAHSRESLERLAASINSIDKIDAGVTPSGALLIMVYKTMSDGEILMMGLQLGECLAKFKREEEK